jgi:RNA polymerase sigma-70 factor (ECF subfamily)
MATSSPASVGSSIGDRDAAAGVLIQAAIEAFQARQDREQSFHVLFNAYYRPLLRFFARKGLSPEDRRDLTQETLLGIYKGLDGYRREARFETWLYRIATTAFLKRLRAQHAAKRAGEVISTDEAVPVATLQRPAEQLGSILEKERRDEVHRAIEALPEQMRRALILRIHRQLSYKEIATVMRLSIDTVKAHLFQARKKLKDQLGDEPLSGLEV